MIFVNSRFFLDIFEIWLINWHFLDWFLAYFGCWDINMLFAYLFSGMTTDIIIFEILVIWALTVRYSFLGNKEMEELLFSTSGEKKAWKSSN